MLAQRDKTIRLIHKGFKFALSWSVGSGFHGTRAVGVVVVEKVAGGLGEPHKNRNLIEKGRFVGFQLTACISSA